MYSGMMQPTTFDDDEHTFVQGLLQISNNPMFEGTYWINYESVKSLIHTLPITNDLAFPTFEKRMSTEMLRAAASFVQIQANHDIFRYWNTQAVIRLCNHYSFHVGDALENVMTTRLLTQNFYTPMFGAQNMMMPMQPPMVPLIMPQMNPAMLQQAHGLGQMQHIPQMQSFPQQTFVPQMQPQTSNEPRKLFVVNFPPDWDSQAMTSVFNQFGEVSRCKVCGTFAFVTMSRREDAQNARMALNGAQFEEGAVLTVTVANGNTSRNSKVFLQNIPLNWKKVDITRIVSVYGEVIGCHLIHEKKYMNTKCAIVRFINDEGARGCIDQLAKASITDPYNPNTLVELHAEYAIYDKRAVQSGKVASLPAQSQPSKPVVKAQPIAAKESWESKPSKESKPLKQRAENVLYEKSMLTLFETPMTLLP